MLVPWLIQEERLRQSESRRRVGEMGSKEGDEK